MADQGTTSEAGPATAEPLKSHGSLPEWMAQAVQQGVKPEQALAFIGLGLMGKLADGGKDTPIPWIWNDEEDGGSFDATALRQRLELVQLALQTGAPLSTAEVTHLLGAKPGTAVVQRGASRPAASAATSGNSAAPLRSLIGAHRPPSVRASGAASERH